MRFLPLFVLLVSFSYAEKLKELNGTCPKNEHWVKAHHRRSYYRADGTLVSATEVSAHCQKNPGGYADWQSKFKNGRPKNWHPKIEKSKVWTVEETERVLEALESLPEKLNKYLGPLYRMDSSIFGDNPGKEEDGNIVLYDTAFIERYNLARVVAHELSHAWFEHLSSSDRLSYLQSAQWRRRPNGQNAVGRPREAFVHPHGMDSTGEDFSVNVEHYLFDTDRLKNTTPRVYEWIKEHYGSWLRIKK